MKQPWSIYVILPITFYCGLTGNAGAVAIGFASMAMIYSMHVYNKVCLGDDKRDDEL